MTKGENLMFSRYYGRFDLLEYDTFWDDCLVNLKDRNIQLPMQFNPHSLRYVMELLKCESCGECCRTYKSVRILEHDAIRSNHRVEKGDMKGNPCQWLGEHGCEIYDKRPDTCYLFPIQSEISDGNMYYRLKCKPSLKVIRHIFTGFLENKNHILLPNLQIVTKEE